MATSETTPSVDPRRRRLELAIKRQAAQADALIEILHEAQSLYGYLDRELLQWVAEQLALPRSKVYGVASFYHLFQLNPSGRHRCHVCLGTACYVKGSKAILDCLIAELGIREGETTNDGSVSLGTVRCVGACGIAPVVVYDGDIQGRQESEAVWQQVQAWQQEAH